jgi:hypothetical protein
MDVGVLYLDEGGDFGGDVAGVSAAVKDVVLELRRRRVVKVDDDGFSGLTMKYDVLGLDISMHDPKRV